MAPFPSIRAIVGVNSAEADGAQSALLRSLNPALRKVASLVALSSLLVACGCLTFAVASFASFNTLYLLKREQSPKIVRKIAEAAMYSPAHSDFFSPAAVFVCWLALEAPTLLLDWYRSRQQSEGRTRRKLANRSAENAYLKKELERSRRAAKKYERGLSWQQSRVSSKIHELRELKSHCTQLSKYSDRLAVDHENHIRGRRFLEANLRYHLLRQTKQVDTHIAEGQQNLQYWHKRTAELHSDNGYLQEDVEDLRMANDLLERELEERTWRSEAQAARQYEEIAELLSRIDNMGLAYMHLQQQLEDERDARQMDHEAMEAEREIMHRRTTALVQELEEQMEDRAEVEQGLCTAISMVLDRDTAAQEHLQRADTRSAILQLRIGYLEDDISTAEAHVSALEASQSQLHVEWTAETDELRQQLSSQLEKSANETAALRQEITDASAGIQAMRAVMQEDEDQSLFARSKITALHAEIEELQQQLSSHQANALSIDTLRQELSSAKADLRSACADAQEHEHKSLRLAREIASLQADAALAEDKYRTLEEDHTALEKAFIDAETSRADLETSRTALDQKAARLETELYEAAQAKEKAQELLAKLATSHRKLKTAHETTKKDLLASQTECARFEGEYTDAIEQTWLAEKALREEQKIISDVSQHCSMQIKTAEEKTAAVVKLYQDLEEKHRKLRALHDANRLELDHQEKLTQTHSEALAIAQLEVKDLRAKRDILRADLDKQEKLTNAQSDALSLVQSELQVLRDASNSRQPSRARDDATATELRAVVDSLESELEMMMEDGKQCKEFLRTLLDQETAAREKAEDALEELRRSLVTPDSSCPSTPALVAYSPGSSTSILESPAPQTPSLEYINEQPLECGPALTDSPTMTQIQSGHGLGLTF